MVVGVKDVIKLITISIIVCCAVLVCTMFLNFYIDITDIKELITSTQVMSFYDAQVSTALVVSCLSGGCLFITSVIMLMFYIKHHIHTHKKELGILKALGYSNITIAKNFWVFGMSVFTGSIIGYGGAYLIMPFFYDIQNKDQILPTITIHFHPILFISLVIIPTLVFAILSIFYAYRKLKKPVMELIKDNNQGNTLKAYKPQKNTDLPFLMELKKATLKGRKTLVFFIVFASFCFSSMTQMSMSVEKLSSVMMSIMIISIGIVLSCTTLFLAITTVINSNTKTIAIMRVFGYSQKECCQALLGGYRPLGYIGFIIGTLYQYALIKLMVSVVFQDVAGVPHFEFDWQAMLISLIAFIFIYEIIMSVYTKRIQKISIKEIMLE